MSGAQQFGLRQLFVLVTCAALGLPLILTNHHHLWRDAEGLSLSVHWVVSVALIYSFLWSVAAILATYLAVDVASRTTKTGLIACVAIALIGVFYNVGAGIWIFAN